MLVLPIARNVSCHGCRSHSAQTEHCALWVSLTWLHSSPWSVVLDPREKDEMWLSCWDALHRLEAPVPLCFFYCHLISFPPFSEVQRKSLLHTREADKVLKGLQTFLYLSGLETKARLCKENFCLDVTRKKTQPTEQVPIASNGTIWGFSSFPAQLLIAYMQFCCNTNLSALKKTKKNPVLCYLIWWLIILNR